MEVGGRGLGSSAAVSLLASSFFPEAVACGSQMVRLCPASLREKSSHVNHQNS